MKLRGRILVASILLVVLPLLVLSWLVRQEMSGRLGERYTERVTTLMDIIDEDLLATESELSRRLGALRTDALDDSRLRLALGGRASERRYLLDYAIGRMTLAGLDMLQIQDRRGKILCSGHFRNEYDRFDAGLAGHILAAGDGGVLITARHPDGDFTALARADSFTVGERRFFIVGGVRVDDDFMRGLTRDRDLAASLVFSGGAFTSAGELRDLLVGVGRADLPQPQRTLRDGEHFVASRAIPLVRADREGRRVVDARLIVSHSRAPLRALLRDLDLWLALVVAITVAGVLVLALGLSARLSRPLRRLATRTAEVDLDRLDVDFASDRGDEVGTLARLLAEMTSRLREGVQRLRQAERRAALGDLARQVNHDVRNGFTPIRNVLRHLGEVAEQEPEQMAEVFRQRRGTLESGLGYLEELADNYARLAPDRRRRICDLNAVVGDVVAGAPATLELAEPAPQVTADPVGLRRIVENLVRNAREAMAGREGRVTVTTAIEDGQVTLRIADEGCGIAPADLDRIFGDFYTTRDEGTGLGLSIVRRLVADSGGRITVDSTEGEGSVFTVTLPPAGENAP